MVASENTAAVVTVDHDEVTVLDIVESGWFIASEMNEGCPRGSGTGIEAGETGAEVVSLELRR